MHRGYNAARQWLFDSTRNTANGEIVQRSWFVRGAIAWRFGCSGEHAKVLGNNRDGLMMIWPLANAKQVQNEQVTALQAGILTRADYEPW